MVACTKMFSGHDHDWTVVKSSVANVERSVQNDSNEWKKMSIANFDGWSPSRAHLTYTIMTIQANGTFDNSQFADWCRRFKKLI